MSAPQFVTSASAASAAFDIADHSVTASLDGAGVYDAFGRSLIDGRPPCGNDTDVTKIRPVVRSLTTNDTLEPSDIERIWLLPLGVDPGPVPPDVLGELVATLERGKAVVLCGTHEKAIEVASGLISDMVGGAQA